MYFETKLGALYNGDCLEVLKGLPDNCVTSIVTDPPYGISFMGKKWDYQIPNVEIWKECLRVLKPGGHALVACGTRTQHRMAVNLEDAGFELRDIIGWVYGSGFPKSLNIGKAIDKLQGNEREIVGKTVKCPPGLNKGLTIGKGWAGEFPDTKGNSKWEGYGTALKPSMELWTLCRKPLSEKTIAANVLKWGTGGLNIDGCRVVINPEVDDKRLGGKGSWSSDKMAKNVYEGGYVGERVGSSEQGRFPANLIHDGSKQVMQLFPDTRNRGHFPKNSGGIGTDSGIYGKGVGKDQEEIWMDNGSAARFFYCAKASRSERGKGNNHPTVKPLKLIEYLCKLITPPSGVCLDPFLGSGTTAIACEKLGYNWIGIEINEEYCNISKHRIENVSKKKDALDAFFE